MYNFSPFVPSVRLRPPGYRHRRPPEEGGAEAKVPGQVVAAERSVPAVPGLRSHPRLPYVDVGRPADTAAEARAKR